MPGSARDEQAQLVAERAVQADLAEGAPDRLDAALELRRAGRGDRDGERRAQQRRMARGLKVGEQVARVLRAVVAAVGDALVAARLGARDLVGVLDAAAHQPHRECRWRDSARRA